MATDIFEKSVITFRGQVLSGHKSAKTATFKIFKNGVFLTAPSAPLKDKKCELPWPCPELEDDVESYALSFKMEIEGREYNITDRFKVWPRSLHLTALRSDNDKPLAHFAVKVTQGGADAPAITDAKGECTHFLKKPAPFDVSAEAPGVIKEWIDKLGRKRAFKAERKIKAEFVAPKKPTPDKALEQLVNHTTSDEGRDLHGSLVVVKVGALGDTTRAPDDRWGQKDDEVFIKAKFSRQSKRNAPLPSLKDALDIKHTPDGKEYTGKVKLGAKGEPARFKIELGLAGGDTCELSIGSTAACADATLSFVNWRKLYYQLTLPSGLAKPGMGDMEGALAKVFVRYEKYKDLTFAEADAPPAGSWFDGPMVSANLSGRCVCIGTHNKGHFHAKFVDTKNPRGVHLLVCHAQFDGGAGKAQFANLAAVTIKKATPKITFPPDGGTSQYGARVDGSKAGGQIFEMAFQDGGKGWRNAKWKSLAATGPHKGKSGAIPDDHVDVNWRKRPNVVTMKLPADAVTVVEAGFDVRVSVDVFYSLGPFNGESVQHLQLIRTRHASEGGDKGMNGTMTHELGHTMKQVVDNVPPGLKASDHGRKYEKRGHQGPHCADGVDAKVFKDGGSLKGRTDCTCVMFGQGASTRPVDFCARCAPFVTAENIAKIT